MYYITQALHVPQAILSAYGLFLSYQSISKLREYEAASEKAAEWSQTAADQLHKTRTTQASGAITILFSFSTSLLLIAAPNDIPSILRYTLSPVLLIATIFSRAHMANFWDKKAKVPLLQGFNDAIRSTQDILGVLKLLEYSWVLLSFVGAVVGY